MRPSKYRYALMLIAMMFAVKSNATDLMVEIDGANKAFAKAIVENDIEHLVNDYTDDGCIIAPSTPKTCGKIAIRAFWQTVIASKPKDVEIVTLTAEGESGLAVATGDLLITDAGGTLHESRFVLAFKKVTGLWKLHVDSWTPK